MQLGRNVNESFETLKFTNDFKSRTKQHTYAFLQIERIIANHNKTRWIKDDF